MRYADIQDKVEFELWVDDVLLVILKPTKKRGPEANLIGFRKYESIWQLDPPTNSGQIWDGYTTLSIKDGQVWAFSWTGFLRRIDHRTGEVLEETFTK